MILLLRIAHELKGLDTDFLKIILFIFFNLTKNGTNQMDLYRFFIYFTIKTKNLRLKFERKSNPTSYLLPPTQKNL
jgi:hypothetical protein